MKSVIIVGAGAAGMMAAITAARHGASVTVIEKNNIVGKKMGITGKGRCNITNDCSVEDLILHTPGNGKFLYSAYSVYDNSDLLADLTDWGLVTKVERGGRVFPKSDSAIEVRNFFHTRMKREGVKIHFEEKVISLMVKDDAICGVRTDKGEYKADAVILATGGASYPVTGSTGDGQEMAKKLGLKVTELLPALVPLETTESWVKDMMGLSLKNIRADLYFNGKKRQSEFGELLFTHFGLSGPVILKMSRTVSKALANRKKDIYVEIDFKPALTVEQLDRRLQREFDEHKNKQLVNVMGKVLPSKSVSVMIAQAGVEPTKVINAVTKEERTKLVHIMKHLIVPIHKTRPIAEAIVTSGGISTKEISPKTMESKTIKGLYAVGEVLDIDAFTGGYNLQAAFSTGYIAGREAAKED